MPAAVGHAGRSRLGGRMGMSTCGQWLVEAGRAHRAREPAKRARRATRAAEQARSRGGQPKLTGEEFSNKLPLVFDWRKHLCFARRRCRAAPDDLIEDEVAVFASRPSLQQKVRPARLSSPCRGESTRATGGRGMERARTARPWRSRSSAPSPQATHRPNPKPRAARCSPLALTTRPALACLAQTPEHSCRFS